MYHTDNASAGAGVKGLCGKIERKKAFEKGPYRAHRSQSIGGRKARGDCETQNLGSLGIRFLKPKQSIGKAIWSARNACRDALALARFQNTEYGSSIKLVLD